jgi:hypothetical protein
MDSAPEVDQWHDSANSSRYRYIQVTTAPLTLCQLLLLRPLQPWIIWQNKHKFEQLAHYIYGYGHFATNRFINITNMLLVKTMRKLYKALEICFQESTPFSPRTLKSAVS